MNTLSPERLDSIMGADSVAAARHLEGLYDALAGELGGRIVLYGAGDFGRRALAGLRRAGVEPLAFVDGNPVRWGETIDGVQVVSPADAIGRWATDATFVVSVFNGTPIRERLKAEGCASVVPCPALYHRYPEAFLPFGGVCRPENTLGYEDELRLAFDLFEDETSRRAFLGQLRWRLSLDYAALPAPSPAAETYFPPEVTSLEHEVFVDCGAFDGDSLESFFARCPDGRAIAIEPDPANATALRERMARKGQPVTIHNVAVASKPGTLAFAAMGSVSSSVTESGEAVVPCARLDDLLTNEVPTYLKMDIEGAELDALQGGAATIRRHQPVLAICLYHKPEDLWQIPLFIDSLGVDYRYLLRVHAEECWEIVLVAVPAARLRA